MYPAVPGPDRAAHGPVSAPSERAPGSFASRRVRRREGGPSAWG